MVADLLNQSLIVQCMDFEVEYLIVTALSPVTLFSLNLLRKQGVTNIHWFYEDFRIARYWSSVITGYDYFFAIQRGELEALCRVRGIYFQLLPGAASWGVLEGNNVTEFNQPDKSTARQYDGAFIGIPSPYRLSILECLAAKGIKLVIAGSGWEQYTGILNVTIFKNGWVTSSECRSIYNSAKIGLNLSFNDPSSDRDNTQLSPRVYDMAACEMVVVCEESPLIRELTGCLRLHFFQDVQSLCGIVEQCLADYDNEKEHAVSNRISVLNHHTYQQRAEQFIKALKQ
jgi:hypothetical protein